MPLSMKLLIAALWFTLISFWIVIVGTIIAIKGDARKLFQAQERRAQEYRTQLKREADKESAKARAGHPR